ncbi:hypothetical protein [Flavobacterium faecale]|uniref:hypothetical protein n=1 Tax=Flavobacterium faecale TaxID=1355330 RepID=UPI003AAD6258
MNYSAKKTNLKKALFNTLFVFVLLFSVSAFSQSSIDLLTEVEPVSTTNQGTTSRVSSNVEFVLWFMGTKQNPNTTISTEGNSTRNEIITSGLAPNRLLIKAFLKKAVNFEVSVA